MIGHAAQVRVAAGSARPARSRPSPASWRRAGPGGTGSPAAAARRSSARACRPAVGRRRLHAPVGQHLLEDAAVGGVVVHDQHAAAPCRRAGRRHGRRRRLGCRPKRAVKWNVLPLPTSLSTQMRPPISSTSCGEMARPRPVPPNRRVVELSAWLKASKIAAACRRDADAGVARR